MSRFASTKLKNIDLGDGEMIGIPSALSYSEVLKFTSINDPMELSKTLLVECIKEWTIKDEDGNIPEINEENIMRLDFPTISIISEAIAALTKNDQDKKKSV